MATGTITVKAEIVAASERSEALATCMEQTGQRADAWYWAPFLRFEIDLGALPITELTQCVGGLI